MSYFHHAHGCMLSSNMALLFISISFNYFFSHFKSVFLLVSRVLYMCALCHLLDFPRKYWLDGRKVIPLPDLTAVPAIKRREFVKGERVLAIFPTGGITSLYPADVVQVTIFNGTYQTCQDLYVSELFDFSICMGIELTSPYLVVVVFVYRVCLLRCFNCIVSCTCIRFGRHLSADNSVCFRHLVVFASVCFLLTLYCFAFDMLFCFYFV